MGIVRAYQKGTLKGEATPEVQGAASSMKEKDVKKFASTKHKGLPEKKVTKESFNEDYVKELEDGLVKMDYPTYDEVDKLMCKIAKENDIDTTTLHMAFKTKHLMVPDDWAKKKMMEPVMIPKTPLKSVEECWKTHKKVGMKMKGGKLVNDCRPKNEEYVAEISLPTDQVRKKPNPYGKRAVAKAFVSDMKERIGKKVRSMTTVHKEGNLHKWFKGSKSKDGKGGWVNVVTGGTCASDEPGEGTPKCVSSSKRASMTKAERLSASRRKKKADPNQQSKSGAAKPTYVSTDKKKAVKEDFLSMILEVSDAKMFRQSDENLDKLKKKFDGMDSSPANTFMQKRIAKEVKRREQQKRKEMLNPTVQIKDDFMPEITEDCWDGYEKKGMKTMFGKRYPNCVKKKRKSVKEDYYSGKGEINVKRTKDFMDSKGMKGAPGLNAMIARQEEHKNKRGKKKEKGVKTEGMAYGMYKGSGKPSGPMAAYLKKKKEEEKKKKVNEGKNPSRRPSFSLMIMKAKKDKKTKRDEYGDPIKSDGSYAGKKNEDKNPKDQFSNNESYDAKKKAMRDALLSRKESQKVAEKKKSYNEMFEYQKDSVKRQYKGGADYKPEDKKNVVNMNRTPVKKVGARTVPNNAGSYVEKPQRTNEDYHSGQGEKKVARTLKYMKGKGQDGAPGLNAMISRIKDHEARRGVKKKKEKKKEEVTEASKYSSIVRAGIKLGGKKGGRLAQQGEKAALEYGKNKATQAAKGGKDAGGAEKAGAAIGASIGALFGGVGAKSEL